MAEVDILLASYNGEKYIAEQLDSLIAQTFKDIRILIRDDGSTDKTPEIIEDYAKKYPGIIEVIHDDAVCRHPAKNFFQLMKYAEADYVMFCDQDDYWLKYKVEITLDYMKKTERDNPGLPILVFSGLDVVDENLKSIGKFMGTDTQSDSYNNFTKLMRRNCITGCTEMINRYVYENIGEYDELIGLHDHWTALYTCACGKICHIPEVLTLYRQHGNNFVGFSEEFSLRRKLISQQQTSRKHKSFSLKKAMMTMINSAKESRQRFYSPYNKYYFFYQRYSKNMLPEQRSYMNYLLDVWGSNKLARLKGIIKTDFLSDRTSFDKLTHLIKYLLY